VNVTSGNPVLEGFVGAVTFTFINNGPAAIIGGAGTAVFPTTGDPTDFAAFGALNFGNCNPNGANSLGRCAMFQPFTTSAPDVNEPVDAGTTRIRGGILLANGQMAFGEAQVVVADPPAPAPPPAAALSITPDYAHVAEGDSGVLHFVVTNTSSTAATIAQLSPDAVFLFGDHTDDAGISQATGCAPGTVLASMASCTVAIPFVTPFTISPVENNDFGVTSIGLSVTLNNGNSSEGIGGVLVTDIPEPSTAYLLCLGTLGIICWRRRCGRLSR
jgi:hypothetical protein